jgi:hypothetical protein
MKVELRPWALWDSPDQDDGTCDHCGQGIFLHQLNVMARAIVGGMLVWGCATFARLCQACGSAMTGDDGYTVVLSEYRLPVTFQPNCVWVEPGGGECDHCGEAIRGSQLDIKAFCSVLGKPLPAATTVARLCQACGNVAKDESRPF